MSERYRFKSSKKAPKVLLTEKSEHQTEMDLVRRPHTEIFSNKRLTVDGCVGVFEYREDFIKLRLQKGSMIVCGDCLTIICYENKMITIGGKLSSLEFCIG